MSSDSRGSTAGPSPRSAAVGRATARYLLAVSVCAEGRRATTGDLQEYLGVTPASVTEMLGKLDDRGLLDYEKYDGAVLTEAGERIATRIARRYCVVETFFESVLETQLDEETAFEIGYLVPEDGVARLRALASTACLDCCPEAASSDSCSA